MKFSIIIPVYNVAPYLRECLGSIAKAIEQCKSKSVECKTEVEVICVDDGSTDGSGAILDEYAAKDVRFRVFHKQNGGVGSARNLGLDEARGEWVWCVDGDDEIHPESLAIIAREVERQQEAPSCVFIGLTYKGFEPIPLHVEGRRFEFNQQSIESLWRTPAYAIFRRDVIGGLRFKNYKTAEDVIFFLEYLNASDGRWLDIPADLYHYKVREGSATTTLAVAKAFPPEFFDSQLEIIRLLRRLLEPHGCFIKWFWNTVYTTPDWRFFKMTSVDMKKLTPLYLRNVYAMNEWVPYGKVRMALIRLLKIVGLPIVGKLMVYRFHIFAAGLKGLLKR